jgi:hypothetical protein
LGDNIFVGSLARDRSRSCYFCGFNAKKMNAEVVTTMTTAFLKRLGHKSGLKLKRFSLEGDVYTVEVERALSEFLIYFKLKKL